MPETFTPGAAMNIGYESVTTTTGSHSPIEPLATLAKYNARDQDLPSIRDKILNNEEFGLPHHQRSMDPNALKDMSTGWTLQKLADVIFEESFPVQEAPHFAMKKAKTKAKKKKKKKKA